MWSCNAWAIRMRLRMYWALSGTSSFERVFDRAHAGHGVHRGAHSAETLGEEPGIARVAAFENVLDTAPHGARSPCIANRIVVDFDIDAKVAFNSRNRINRDSVCHNTCC